MNRPTEDGDLLSRETAVIHPLHAEPGSRLAQWLERWSHPPYFRPLVAALPLQVARVSASAEALRAAGAGLPEGAARAEALAIRLRRLGLRLELGQADRVADGSALLRGCWRTGASSARARTTSRRMC